LETATSLPLLTTEVIMKKSALVLLALLTLVPLAQATAQTPAAVPSASGAQALTPAQFLATLAGTPIEARSTPTLAPLFRTGCTSSADCPTGKLCCNTCGTSPDGGSCLACVTPLRGHCPLVG
jgi:hypothetical protein